MRRALLAIALAAAPSVAGAQMRVVVSLRGYRTPVGLDTLVRTYTIPASPRAVYLAALEVFDGLKLPVNVKDEKRGIVAATRFAKVRMLGGEQLATYFDCGTGMTGPHANDWRIEMAVAALIDNAPNDATRLSLGSVGSANDIEGSKDPISCTPTGQLETRLLDAIRLKVLR